MTRENANDRSARFRALHAKGELLLLPNAWDAASARLFEAAGARAIATTSAGLAWSCGWPDGNALPIRVYAAALEAIARVVGVPISADAEGGYAGDPRAAGEHVAALVGAGAVGINLEDGGDPPELLCAKIDAVKSAAARAGVDLFVNARTDVVLRALVPPERALEETLARGRRYRDAGADGLFVPKLAETDAIRTIAAEIDLPLNLLVVPGLAPPAALRALGVRRVSAGSSIAATAYGVARRAARAFLDEGRHDAMLEGALPYGELNALFARG
ncbi:MAG: isocitrate lyase/phosphoenolpyruvate mutase family protein [Proteobacteria bacterium]|nr:MAG: isocitrate lyase/phosphoenolpyruvate mutase family protein [Pseudomonadota bacterium]